MTFNIVKHFIVTFIFSFISWNKYVDCNVCEFAYKFNFVASEASIIGYYYICEDSDGIPDDSYISYVDQETKCQFNVTEGETKEIFKKFVSRRQHDDVQVVKFDFNSSQDVGWKVLYGMVFGKENITKLRFLPFQVDQLLNLLTFSSEYRNALHDYRHPSYQNLPNLLPCIEELSIEERAKRFLLYLTIMFAQYESEHERYVCQIEDVKQLGRPKHISIARPWLEECCQLEEFDLMGLQKAQSQVGSKEFEEFIKMDVKCHRPDMRIYIVQLAHILSVIITIFSPLLLFLIPTKPWRRRDLKMDDFRRGARKMDTDTKLCEMTAFR